MRRADAVDPDVETSQFDGIKLFLESAVKANLPTPVSNIVGDIYRIGNRDGRGAKDFTSVVEFYEDFTGIRLQSKGTQS